MIFVLDKYETILATLSNKSPKAMSYYDDGHREQLGGISAYEFSVPMNHADSEYIVAENYVIVRNLDKELMLFKIKRTTEKRDSKGQMKEVYAENAAIDDLHGNVVRGTKLVSVNLEQAANHILANTGWKLGRCDVLGLKDLDFSSYPTALAALYMLRDAYEIEIAFNVTFDGARVKDRYVDLVKRRGQVTGKRFTYAKDLVEVEREEDSTELVTALIGVGKSNENGTRVTIAPVDLGEYKPAGQDFLGDAEALQRFGKNGKHIFDTFEDGNADTPQLLFQRLETELKRRCKPRLTYTMTVALLERLTGYEHERVRLGDTITVKDTNFKPALLIEARIIEVTRSNTDPSQDKVTLGEFAPIFVDKNVEIEAIKKQINANMGKWEAGGEVVVKSVEEPLKKTPNMLWLDLSVEPNIMKRWNADENKWVKASPTTAAEIGAETPQGAQDKADLAKDNAVNTAAQDASQKAGTAKTEAIEAAAIDATTKANQAKEDAVKEATDSFGIMERRITNELQDHADAVAQAAEDNARLFTESYAEKSLHVGTTAPTDTTKLWIDTTNKLNVLKRYNATTGEWEAATPTTAGEIGAVTPEEVQTKAEEVKAAAIQEANSYTDTIKDTVEANAQQYADERAQAAQDAAKVFTESYAQKEIMIQNTAPTDLTVLWLDNSKEPNILKRYDTTASKWVDASPTTAGQIGAETPSGAQAKADAAKTAAITAAAADAKAKADAAEAAATQRANDVETSVTEFAKNAGNITQGTLAAERLYGGTIDAQRANIVNINAGSIVTGTLDASKATVTNLNAGNITTGTLSAARLAAGTVTADKLHVLARSLINNPSRSKDFTGWYIEKKAESTYSMVSDAERGQVIKSDAIVDPTKFISDFFEVDPNQTYKVNIGLKIPSNPSTGTQYFGIMCYDENKVEIGVLQFNYSTNTFAATEATNPYFWSGTNVFTTWQDMEAYLLSSDTSLPSDVPTGKNVLYSYRMNPKTRYVKVRFYNGFYSKDTTKVATTYWYSPSVQAVDSGSLTADRITAGTLDAAKVTVTNLSASVLQAGIIDASRVTINNLDASKITAGTLSADKVKGGTIDATNVTILNLNAGNITAGTLNAARIGTQSITTDRLVIGDLSNLCPNPDFKGGTTAEWSGSIGSILATDATVPTGAPTAYVGRQTARDAYCGDFFKVAAGDKFYAEYTAATKDSTANYGVGMYFVDKNFTTVSWNIFTKMSPTATWTTKSGEITAPANAQYARVFSQIDAQSGFGNWFMTNLVLRRKAGAELIVDGSITTQKVNAAGLSADVIKAGTLDASKVTVTNLSASVIQSGVLDAAKVTVNNLSASRITAGTMSADRITGGTINAATTNITNLNASNITAGVMSADRITSGTLDATKVNVRNLNASNITTGTLSADMINGGTIRGIGGGMNINLNDSSIGFHTWDTKQVVSTLSQARASGGTEITYWTVEGTSNSNAMAAIGKRNTDGSVTNSLMVEGRYGDLYIHAPTTYRTGGMLITGWTEFQQPISMSGAGRFNSDISGTTWSISNEGGAWGKVKFAPNESGKGSVGTSAQTFEEMWTNWVNCRNINNFSSLEYKKLIEPLSDLESTKLVRDLPVHKYFYNEDPVTTDTLKIGLIYEEARAHEYGYFITDAENKSVQVYSMVSVLWSAVQRNLLKVDALENENILLTSRVTSLEERLAALENSTQPVAS